MEASDRDLNAEILGRMAARGDDLSAPRPVDFSAVFPDAGAARNFARAAAQLGFKVVVEKSDCVPGLAWDVTATRDMALDTDVISELEASLNTLAERFGGRSDGWGCPSV